MGFQGWVLLRRKEESSKESLPQTVYGHIGVVESRTTAAFRAIVDCIDLTIVVGWISSIGENCGSPLIHA